MDQNPNVLLLYQNYLKSLGQQQTEAAALLTLAHVVLGVGEIVRRHFPDKPAKKIK